MIELQSGYLKGFPGSCGDMPWFRVIVLVENSIELCFWQSQNLLTKKYQNEEIIIHWFVLICFKFWHSSLKKSQNIGLLRQLRQIRCDRVESDQQSQIALLTSILWLFSANMPSKPISYGPHRLNCPMQSVWFKVTEELKSGVRIEENFTRTVPCELHSDL